MRGILKIGRTAIDMQELKPFDFEQWTQRTLDTIEQALTQWVPADAVAPLGQSMRYAVLGGGKRLRPLLCLAARQSIRSHELVGSHSANTQSAQGPDYSASAMDQAALRAACALELIHAYSLVHDDMPCMDDDVLRRGQPTVHVQFGQAMALLCGDALQALAFEILTPSENVVPARVQASLCRQLSQAAGYAGMAGGQAIDLSSVGTSLTQSQLQEMHAKKTGALLHASVMMGALCTGPQEPSLSILEAFSTYAKALGLAFQVVDDILDVESDTQTLGKTVGKDAAHNKPTFVSLLGLQGAKTYAQSLHQEAHDALQGAGLSDTRALAALADLVIKRKS